MATPFHEPHDHLKSTFGDDWFGQKAEMFARFFGTSTFIIAQTILVGVWVGANILPALAGWRWDEYPFILLNLAFSTQAAYAAPMILLAQTRQADRDKAAELADAQHREDLHNQLRQMLDENTRLTSEVHRLATALDNHIRSTT